MDDIRTCSACGKTYEVTIIGDTRPGCREREEIICPSCGHVDGYVFTGGVPRTTVVD